MQVIVGDLSQRAPLVNGCAELFRLNKSQTAMLAMLDQFCVSEDAAEVAQTAFGRNLTMEVREALTILAPARVKPLFSSDALHLNALKNAFKHYPSLDEAAQAVSATQHFRLGEAYLMAWRHLYKGHLSEVVAVNEIRPLLLVYPELVRDLVPELDVDQAKTPDPLYQRSLINGYLRDYGPFDIDLVAESVTDDELLTLACCKNATPRILSLLEERSGPEVMVDAYLNAVFAHNSSLGNCIPEWVESHPEQFAERFMNRLDTTRASGKWFGYTSTVSQIFQTVIDHLNDEQAVRLCLGSRLLQAMPNGASVHKNHPIGSLIQRINKRPKGEVAWGPMIKQLALYLDTATDARENGKHLPVHSAVKMLLSSDLNYTNTNVDTMFKDSPLRLLSTKPYLDQLAYPVNANRQVIDYIDPIIEHVRDAISDMIATPRIRESLIKKLNTIEVNYARQKERLLARGVPQALAVNEDAAPTMPALNADVL